MVFPTTKGSSHRNRPRKRGKRSEAKRRSDKKKRNITQIGQRQKANETPLPDVAEGESSSTVIKQELTDSQSSQPDPATSVAGASLQSDAEGPPPQSDTEGPPPQSDTEGPPPPKVAKISKPKVDKVPSPSLIVEGPRQRKATKRFTPVSKAWLEIEKTPKPKDYVFKGKRMVNMNYFIKSLQTLNDHNGEECNFSDMKVCAETRDGWNVGIVFTCQLCPITKVIWMEDPSSEDGSKSPIIVKPNPAVQPNFAAVQPIQPSSLLRPPTPTVYQTVVQRKLPITPPAPHIQKRVRQPYWSKRKTPTPPPDNAPPDGHLKPPTTHQIAMQMRELPNYSNQIMIRPNTTLCYGPPQTSFTGQLGVQSVIGHQVPAIVQSQRSVINQSVVNIMGQSQVPIFGQPQDPVLVQTQPISQLQGSVIGQPQAHTIVQSQVPLIDFPQVTTIKQEIILPDDGTSSSRVNPSLEPTQVEMTFCVDQGESTTQSRSVPSDAAMNVADESVATSPDGFSHTQTSLQRLSGQLSSSTVIDMNTTCGVVPANTLLVDLNLVKKEIDDGT